jgi:hypothetical protein
VRRAALQERIESTFLQPLIRALFQIMRAAMPVFRARPEVSFGRSTFFAPGKLKLVEFPFSFGASKAL